MCAVHRSPYSLGSGHVRLVFKFLYIFFGLYIFSVLLFFAISALPRRRPYGRLDVCANCKVVQHEHAFWNFVFEASSGAGCVGVSLAESLCQSEAVYSALLNANIRRFPSL